MNWLQEAIEARGGKLGDPLLELDLDIMAYEGYPKSNIDLAGAGHSRLILAKDREKFLDELAAGYRAQAAELLRPYGEE